MKLHLPSEKRPSHTSSLILHREPLHANALVQQLVTQQPSRTVQLGSDSSFITVHPHMHGRATDPDHDPVAELVDWSSQQQQYVYISLKDVSVYSTRSLARESNPVRGP